jgi:outer membrane protein assembly factor BamB
VSSYRNFSVTAERVFVTANEAAGITLTAFDRASGSRAYTATFSGGHVGRQSAVTSAGDVVYLGTTTGHLYAIAASDGELLADVDLGEEVISEPVISEGQVFVTTQSALHSLSIE